MTPEDAAERFLDLAAIMAKATLVAAEAYANGGPGRSRGIVAKHFTKGNRQRYGWPQLSFEYAMQKGGQTKALKKGMKKVGRQVPAGKELPVLVRTGALRSAMTQRTHKIRLESVERAVITFANLPPYAKYHHKGGANGRPPKRDFVTPNQEDIEEVRRVYERFINGAIRAAKRGVPISRSRTSATPRLA